MIKNVSQLEITEVVLVHCNIVNRDYQHDLTVSYTFVPNKVFCPLFHILPNDLIFSKTFNSEFSYIGVRFNDQNSKVIEIDDKIDIVLTINESVTYKKWFVIQLNLEIELLLFAKNMRKNISKNRNDKCRKNLLDHAKHSTKYKFRTVSKRTIH